MIKGQNINKNYLLGESIFPVLRDINLEIPKGEFIAIMGPSGSGKSTLLNLLGGLDTPDEGDIFIDGNTINKLNERKRTLFRRKNVGFIFQNYQLLPNMTVTENIAFPMQAAHLNKNTINERISFLIQAVKLEGKENNFPSQLSGGQQQRVSIARALSMQPKLILADEPTGNLDRKTGTEVLQLLSSLHRNEGLTIVMVTHDILAASYADRIILLRDGIIESDIKTEGDTDDVMASVLSKLNT
ncbi:ABC transporter ATP-binding protein [Bacillus paranthracis]|uniref:ABC transporter ATP-binding protein n=1 Tax=Bacillus TaxID=1386 RepID=UPI000200F36F|nr:MULTISPECIES: ABC transporter ATP-binding protein [Bacillus]ADY24352.1 peptide ABC transporter ATP-binding protein [Bacillus thuringiensis serovar finitimus YBT-020]MCW4577217.1 ABC transporter ATP-binding protein [Bacillus pacificus]MDA1585511.1 ABC transporter ATP-binding protein [Bacillus cereus group sp. TH230-1LC]MRC72455.1 ATP-binding cassette domain-containing protein [Bacillus thuringiensis]OTX73112.1 ABC transporter ATP-binding protein [Bacillus thuringiensis serovar finitimus]